MQAPVAAPEDCFPRTGRLCRGQGRDRVTASKDPSEQGVTGDLLPGRLRQRGLARQHMAVTGRECWWGGTVLIGQLEEGPHPLP